MTSQNPAQKLFRYLNEDAKPGDVENIHKYTGQTTSDILGRGCEMSEVVNRCLDPDDDLTFGDAFDEFEER